MKAELAVIGKTTDSHLRAGIEDYINRIGHYLPFSLTVIPEPRAMRHLSEEQQKIKEGEQLLKLMQVSDTVVLLDEHGREYRSLEFADWLQKKMNTVRRLLFIIGGPYGFSESVYARANEKIALSKMTFSHEMVRLVFTEQLYRACTIIHGEPYHHE